MPRVYVKTNRIEDHIGRVYGKLTVIGFAGMRKTAHGDWNQWWRVRCECGVEKDMMPTRLLCDRVRACRACARSRYKNAYPVKSWYIVQVRTKAHLRKLAFEVTEEYIADLWTQQGGRCALTGVPISFGAGFADRAEQSASLDRIDSSLGYIPGNVQWVHKAINLMKLNHSVEEFVMWCRKVAEHDEENSHSHTAAA